MFKNLKHISISNYTTVTGLKLKSLNISYQVFGQALGTAPIVLVNHALTGNSQVVGKQGWWNTLIGESKVVDTNTFTILAINIPGNGYDNQCIENYKEFVAKDIAKLFLKVLEELKIDKLHSIIGGSLGGGIAWEMAVLNPAITTHLIPVAADWKSSDWLIANCLVQDQILNNSSNPIHDARLHAMLCYRSPESFKERFQRSINEDKQLFNVETWLLHHGEKLRERFQLSAYKLMNHLLRTIEASSSNNYEVDLCRIQSNIHMIAVDSDLFFTAKENYETYQRIKPLKSNIYYHEIQSIHGHDAFLIEFDQLTAILSKIFNTKNIYTSKTA